MRLRKVLMTRSRCLQGTYNVILVIRFLDALASFGSMESESVIHVFDILQIFAGYCLSLP